MFRFLTAVTACNLVLCACSTAGNGLANRAAGDHPGDPDLTPEGRGAYVAVAGAFDLYEIRSAEIARQRTRNAQVRDFAERGTPDHRRITEQVLSAARGLGMDALPPAMMPMHWEMLRQLERVSASGFDELYARQQVRAHEMALELHRNYARNGDVPSLRSVAATAAPVIEQHLARARQLG